MLGMGVVMVDSHLSTRLTAMPVFHWCHLPRLCRGEVALGVWEVGEGRRGGIQLVRRWKRGEWW